MILYNYANIVITVNGVELSGLITDSDCCKIEERTELVQSQFGIDGTAFRSSKQLEPYRVSVSLIPSSPSISYLNGLREQIINGDLEDNLILTITIDKQGRGYTFSGGVITNEPEFTIGTSLNAKTFSFEFLAKEDLS